MKSNKSYKSFISEVNFQHNIGNQWALRKIKTAETLVEKFSQYASRKQEKSYETIFWGKIIVWEGNEGWNTGISQNYTPFKGRGRNEKKVCILGTKTIRKATLRRQKEKIRGEKEEGKVKF